MADSPCVLRKQLSSSVPVIAACAALPVLLLWLVGTQMVMPPLWVHFYGVGVSALVATAGGGGAHDGGRAGR